MLYPKRDTNEETPTLIYKYIRVEHFLEIILFPATRVTFVYGNRKASCGSTPNVYN